ncbi:hypothetical protein NE562_03505 [Butyricicoccus faecihominis]|uniref:DUF6809 family protein n=1 Tax=Butyricicoccus faecihominis TaxID=1712515 RepID=UPI00247AEBDD|nr:DUF6809 family protein [Butyricicoccus faecihominis]MCQ5128710.1 hypothetical protein [Butyricicoccus faecihominis]
MDNGLFHMLQHGQAGEVDAKGDEHIESTVDALRQTLDQNQRKLLLQIIDEKDLFNEVTAQNYYESGFRAATKLMIECLYLK